MRVKMRVPVPIKSIKAKDLAGSAGTEELKTESVMGGGMDWKVITIIGLVGAIVLVVWLK